MKILKGSEEGTPGAGARVRYASEMKEVLPPASRWTSDVAKAGLINAAFVMGLAVYFPVRWALLAASVKTADVAIAIIEGVGFALVAGWRTIVHARAWKAGHRSWRSVWEAGGCAFAGTLLFLREGIIRRPTEAPPYIIVYGAIGIVAGLIAGLLLRALALGVLDEDPADP